MFRSATLKLMLWYVVLAVSLSLLFSVVLYRFTTHELTEALYNQREAFTHSDHDSDNQKYAYSQELDNRSQHFMQNLFYFNVVVFVGSIAASYVLARRTLRPIAIAHQAQVRFTAEASHELRTPLAAMKADTEAALMTNKSTTARLRRTLQDNLKDIEKLERLTNHLLEIARFQNKTSKHMEVIDLEDSIQKSIRQFRQAIRSRKLKVKTVLVPLQIEGDMLSIGRLVTIVLDNAIKYSKPNGVITIQLVQENEHAKLTFHDNGVGIRAQDLPHVFERFYRSSPSQAGSQKSHGHGLGLSLAREIVAQHHGTIEAQSTEHAGTTITVTLPLLK